METYPDYPGSKTATPETSRQAADAIAPSAQRLRDKCLSRLRVEPLTADELAGILDETILAIRPRVSELVKMGEIVDSEIRRRNASGKMAAVWKVAPPKAWKEQNLFS